MDISPICYCFWKWYCY